MPNTFSVRILALLLATGLFVVGCGDEADRAEQQADGDEVAVVDEGSDASGAAEGTPESVKSAVIAMFDGIAAALDEVDGVDEVADIEPDVAAHVDRAIGEMQAFFAGGGTMDDLEAIMEGDPDVEAAQDRVDQAGEAVEERSMEAAEALEELFDRQMQKFQDAARASAAPEGAADGK